MSRTGHQRAAKSGKKRAPSLASSSVIFVSQRTQNPLKVQPLSGRGMFSVQKKNKVMGTWHIISAMIQSYPAAEAGDRLANRFDQVDNGVSGADDAKQRLIVFISLGAARCES